MINATFPLIILSMCMSCQSKSQDIKSMNSHKKTTMIEKITPEKRFNITEFTKKINSDKDYYGFTTNEGIEIRQLAIMDEKHFALDFNPQFVIQYIQKETSQDRFSEKYYFDKDGTLTEYNKYFFDVEVGIWKTYSKEGKILTELNKDEHYPFSVNDVVKFSKEHQGDLSKNGSIKRYFDTKLNKYVYEIEWVVDAPSRSYTRAFILDGTNGQIIKELEKSVPWIRR